MHINVLKWIGGIVLSAILTLGVAIFVFHHVLELDMAHPTPMEFWISDLVLSVVFGLFLFLAGWFAPAWKRNAAWFALILSLLFIMTGIFSHIKFDGYLASDHIIRYSSFTLALMIAMYISYRHFGRHKWNG